ncbi:unnamed protein product [Vicia faba]|uniref:Uncharacterized protein n=1 Tax=Vicia faba TaxID=3906 RepID=A0AAV1BAC7_VICFA|nr:unnamed protein product [Vicia faba]
MAPMIARAGKPMKSQELILRKIRCASYNYQDLPAFAAFVEPAYLSFFHSLLARSEGYRLLVVRGGISGSAADPNYPSLLVTKKQERVVDSADLYQGLGIH